MKAEYKIALRPRPRGLIDLWARIKARLLLSKKCIYAGNEGHLHEQSNSYTFETTCIKTYEQNAGSLTNGSRLVTVSHIPL